MDANATKPVRYYAETTKLLKLKSEYVAIKLGGGAMKCEACNGHGINSKGVCKVCAGTGSVIKGGVRKGNFVVFDGGKGERTETPIPINEPPANEALLSLVGKVEHCMVIGVTADGEYVNVTTIPDGPSAVWLLEFWKSRILKTFAEDAGYDVPRPNS